MSQDPRTPHRVTLDIVADRYVETVFDARDNVLHERTFRMESAGRARATTRGDVYTSIDDRWLDGLCDEIDSLGMPAFGVAQQLFKLKYEDDL